MTRSHPWNRQIAEEAVAWVVAMDEGRLDHRRKEALLAWLKTSPVHLEEMLMAQALFEGFSDSDAQRDADVEALLREVSAEDVVPLNRVRVRAKAPLPRGRWWWWAGGVAACCAVALAGVGLSLPAGPKALELETALGERRTLTLEDGSVLHINTLSRVAVRYSATARTVEVDDGEVLVDVERDPARPFRVEAGATVVEAVGTRFSVRFIEDETGISVLEGTVALSGPRTRWKDPRGDRLRGEQLLLRSGEQATLTPRADHPEVSKIDPDEVGAWTQGRLVFDGTRLDEVAREFNRYNRKRIVIEDAEMAAEQISGVFSTDDPESLVDFLEMTGPVQSQRSPERLRIFRSP